jgi:hypothetical protein
MLCAIRRHRDAQRQGTPSAAMNTMRTRERPPGRRSTGTRPRALPRVGNGEGEPVDATWGILEALRGHRRPPPADPSRATARLPDTLAPSCHERPPTGLWRRVRPLDANLSHCGGNLRGVVREAPEHPAEGSVLGAADSGDPAGGRSPIPGIAPHPRPRLRYSANWPAKACFVRSLRSACAPAPGDAALASMWGRWWPPCRGRWCTRWPPRRWGASWSR